MLHVFYEDTCFIQYLSATGKLVYRLSSTPVGSQRGPEPGRNFYTSHDDNDTFVFIFRVV
jgi:hypothetical protein